MIRRAALQCGSTCRSIATSDVGWLFAALHSVVLVLCVANMSPPDPEFAAYLDDLSAEDWWSSATVYAGRPFHWHYESLPLKLLSIADIPALLFAAVPASGLEAVGLMPTTIYYQSYVVFGAEIVFGSIQWLIVGAIFSRCLKTGRRGEWLVGAFRRRRRIVFGALIVILLVGAPLLQWRSDRLGFRHGGISFGPVDGR